MYIQYVQFTFHNSVKLLASWQELPLDQSIAFIFIEPFVTWKERDIIRGQIGDLHLLQKPAWLQVGVVVLNDQFLQLTKIQEFESERIFTTSFE